MAESIKRVAQMAQDSFYQDFKPAGAFLRIEHFLWLCIAADSKLKQDEYEKQIALRRQLRQPGVAISMSADNYVTIEVAVKNEKAKLPTPIMTFSGDTEILGVRDVKPLGTCKNFMRLNPEEEWMACDIPDVVFWKPDCDTIKFVNLKKNCNPDKVQVSYIPQLNGKSTVQESRKWAILNMVTSFIKAAKDGVIMDMSNDGNSNVAQQTEINKYILKALQNR
jgi:hypothetical protein